MTSPVGVSAADADLGGRLALARAVAGAGDVYPYRGDGSNHLRPTRALTLEEAVAARKAYVVPMSPHALCVDLDGDEAADEVPLLAGVLAHAGFGSLVQTSGGQGRYHVFVSLVGLSEWGRDRVRKTLARRYGDKDVRTAGQRMRPPLTPHRVAPAHAVRLCEPRTVEDAVVALQAAATDASASQLAALVEGLPGPRPAVLRRIEGWDTAEEGYRSTALFRASMALANDGVTGPSQLAVLRRLGAWDKALGKPDPEAWAMKHVIARACRNVAERPRQSSEEARLAEVEGHIRAAASATGVVDGAMRRKVLHGLQSIAMVRGGGQFAMSIRELADAAGCSVGTASSHLSALRDGGWVERVGIAQRAGEANTYRLRLPPGVTAGEHYDVHPLYEGHVHDMSVVAATGHDAFRHGALAPTVATFLQLDVATPRRVADIASATGAHERTVFRHLAKLNEAGVVASHAGGHRLVADWALRLDDAALQLGTAGMGDEQRKRHVRERHNYLAYRIGHLVRASNHPINADAIMRELGIDPWTLMEVVGDVGEAHGLWVRGGRIVYSDPVQGAEPLPPVRIDGRGAKSEATGEEPGKPDGSSAATTSPETVDCDQAADDAHGAVA